ncbi:MAG: DnaB-like helicase C-terminal domain-containing protein [Thiotrichaceae bacterium]
MNIIDEFELEKYALGVSYIEGQSIRPSIDFCEEVSAFADHGNQLMGTELPWDKTKNCTRLGAGKLSVWAGSNGSGKSLLVGQVMTSAMVKENQKVVIASLEMQPKQTLYRMICQSATCKASRDYSIAWLQKFKDQLWIYDQLNKVATDKICDVVHYSANVLKADHIVIDSLTKCGVGREDYTAQAAFIDRLQWLAKTLDIHIHLVCHMRKSNVPGHIENKNDIRGAAEISDLADNVFIIARNKIKEKELSRQRDGLDYDEQKITNQACTSLSVQKNRDYGMEDNYGLWYEPESGIFKSSENERIAPLEVSDNGR